MQTSSVKSNFLYNSVFQLLVILLPLITTPYVSRVLGADGIGEYAYNFSIAKYFVLFSMMGLYNYGNRTIAAVRDDSDQLSRTFSSIYIMQLSISLIVVLIYMGYIVFFKQAKMAYVLLFYVVSAAFDINWFFFGIEQFKLTVIRNSIIKLLSVACIFVFVRKSSDVYIYGLILALSFIFSQLALWPFVKRFTRFVWPTRQEVFAHIKPNLILFIPVIAVSLYRTLAKIMLGAMTNMAEVGYYENADKIISLPIAFVTSLGTVMLPKMSNLFANRQQSEGEKYTYYSVLFAVFLTSSLGFGLMAISREFVPWFFGSGFDSCITLFTILAPSTIFIAIANVIRTQYLIPRHQDKVYIVSVFIGAITNIIINFSLIPKMQSTGAAVGTLIAEIVVCLYQFIIIRNEASLVSPIIKSIPFVLSGIVMVTVIRCMPLFFSSMLLNIIFEVFIGIIIYFGSLVVILVVRKRIFKLDSVFPDGITVLFKRSTPDNK